MKLLKLFNQGVAVLRAKWHFRGANTVGARVRVWGRPSVRNYGTMIIGDRCRFDSSLAITEIVSGPHGKLDIGENVFINYGCSIAATDHIKIGDHCNIGTHVMIMDSDFHRLEPERRNEAPEHAPIILGENVWLGGRVIVLKGVTIGKDSVIAAGSIVTKDVPPRVVAAGIPARIVKEL